jgi:hypothetical protein
MTSTSVASLEGVLKNDTDAFRTILDFLGHPFDFRRLSQTCHSMHTYFQQDCAFADSLGQGHGGSDVTLQKDSPRKRRKGRLHFDSRELPLRKFVERLKDYTWEGILRDDCIRHFFNAIETNMIYWMYIYRASKIRYFRADASGMYPRLQIQDL